MTSTDERNCCRDGRAHRVSHQDHVWFARGCDGRITSDLLRRKKLRHALIKNTHSTAGFHSQRLMPLVDYTKVLRTELWMHARECSQRQQCYTAWMQFCV